MRGRLYTPVTVLPLFISTVILPNATVGVAYSTTLAASGGVPPYSWSLLSVVPDTGGWLSILSSGTLNGTPVTAETEVVLVQVQDSLGTKASSFFSLSVSAAVVSTLSFPRVMLVGVGGDQSYGSNAGNSYSNWLTAASGNTANTAIQTIGAYDIAILNGSFEGWDINGSRDRENLTKALLKGTSYTVKLSNSRRCLPFYYQMMMSISNGGPYQTYYNLVQANNWWLYQSTGGTGTITGGTLVNYSTAWPTAIGSAGIGASICGNNYGTLSSGSPTGMQGPARSMGNYVALKMLIRNNAGVDSRFSFNPQMASPSAGGIFLDNCFIAIDGSGSLPNSSLDGITLAPGSQVGAFPTLDTVQPVMARGNHNMFDQLQTMTSTYQVGSTFYNFANFGQYANKYQFGTATLTAGLENTLHGGLLENALGSGSNAWECFQIGNPNTGNTTYPSGWPNLLANYYQGMDFCRAPKMVGLGTKLPATDGSQTASWPVGSGTTLTTVTTGTALEYQLMRYGLCTTLLDDGYFAPGLAGGYDWSKLRWYDEYGDDSLAQVNVKRGYLGTPLTTRPTSPTWAQGTMGVWSRQFTNGIAILNPRGNGSQTVTLSQQYQALTGTQQPSVNNGAVISSITVPDGDGRILILPTGTIYLQEDYNTYPAGNITSISAALSAKGYFSVTFTNATDVQILARANLPAGLLANANFPAGKTQASCFTLSALENEARLTWVGFPNTTTRDVSWSWWEYRDNNNNGGEKFHRAGNYVNASVGGSRGIDDIIGMGLPAGTLTLFANSSLGMNQFPDQAMGVFNWPSGLHHFERVDHLPTDTSATYSCSLYIDGNLQATVSGIQIYANSTQAQVGWQLWDFGGWASGSGTFPIKRYICAARVASTRQGVWAMNAV